MTIQTQKISSQHKAVQLIQNSKGSTFEAINIYHNDQLSELHRHLKDNLRNKTFTLLLIKGK